MANQRLRRDIERLIGQGAQVVADPSHRAQLVLRAPGEGGGVRKLRVVKPDGTPTPAGIELQRQLNADPGLLAGGGFNLALADHLSDTHVLQPNGRFRLARRPPPPDGGGEVQHTTFGRRRFEKARAEWIVHVPVIWGRYDPDHRILETGWYYFRSEANSHKTLTDLTALELPHDVGVVRDMGSEATQKAFLQEAVRAFITQRTANWGVLPPYEVWGPGRGEREFLPELLEVSDFQDSHLKAFVDPRALSDFAGYRFDVQRRFALGRRSRGGGEHPRPFVETILDRPLRGLVTCPRHMWNKFGLMPQALEEHPGGRCVPVQLLQCLTVDGTKHKGRNGGEVKLKYTQLQIESLVDSVFQRLYPGADIYDEAPVEPAECPGSEGPASMEALDQMHERNAEGRAKAWEDADLRSVVEQVLQKVQKAGGISVKALACKCTSGYGAIPRWKQRSIEFLKTKKSSKSDDKTDVMRSLLQQCPRHFRLQGDEVISLLRRMDDLSPAPTSSSASMPSCGRAPPYDVGDWRTVGVTSRLVIEVAKQLRRPIYVLHGDVKIFEWWPEERPRGEGARRRGEEAIVFNVWGDHAFFYTAAGAMGVQHMKVHKRVENEEMPPKLRRALDDDERLDYEKMEALDWDHFDELYAKKKTATFRILREDLEEVEHRLKDYQTWSFYVGMHQLAGISVSLGKKKQSIRFKVVPSNAAALYHFCAEMEKKHGVTLTYKGESPAMCCHRALKALTTGRRAKIPAEDRAELLRRQKNACAVCGEQLKEGGFEVDHYPTPVACGGSNALENLRALCKFPCHAHKSDLELLSTKTYGHSLESQMPPLQWQRWLEDPRPRQIAWSQKRRLPRMPTRRRSLPPPPPRASGIHVRRLYRHMLGSAKPLHREHNARFEAWRKATAEEAAAQAEWRRRWRWQRAALDVKRCRWHNLVYCEQDLPIYGPLDEEEDPFFEDGGLDMSFHYYRIDAAEEIDVDFDETLEEPCEEYRPYHGPGLYPQVAVKHMLRAGLISTDSIVSGWRASRYITGAELDGLLHSVREGLESVGEDAKLPILAMIGLWNSSPASCEWAALRSSFEEDVPDAVYKTLGVQDQWRVRDVYSHRVMSPIGRIALYGEQVCMARARRLLDNCLGAGRILGAFVDCYYFYGRAEEMAMVEEVIADAYYPGADRRKEDNRMFHLKSVADNEAFLKHDTLQAVPEQIVSRGKSTWTVLRENTCDEKLDALLLDACRVGGSRLLRLAFTMMKTKRRKLATLMVLNGGALLTGAAGTGKTVTLKQYHRELKGRHSEAVHTRMGPTHIAARLCGGKTIRHYSFLWKDKGSFGNNWITVDEVGQVGTDVLAELASWKLVGAKFLFCGDFLGQLEPIFDKWQDSRRRTKDAAGGCAVQHSELVGSAVNWLHIELEEYKRGTDQALFDYYCGLYDHVWLSDRHTASFALQANGEDAAECAENRRKQDALVRDAAEKYPPTVESPPDLYLCMSHKKRVALNREANARERVLHPNDAVLLKMPEDVVASVGMAPQDMWIWPGIELLGCVRQTKKGGVTNGVVYRVVSIDTEAKTVVVRMLERFARVEFDEPLGAEEEEEEVASADEAEEEDNTRRSIAEMLSDDRGEGEDGEMTLSFERVIGELRLTHALCYASVQGDTKEGSVMLCDVFHRHFAVRHLILGMSRARHGRNVMIDA